MMNAIYLQSLRRWIRLDARGNKPGVAAEFSIAAEKLAWPVRPELGETDEPVIYAAPKSEVIAALTSGQTRTNGTFHRVSRPRNS